MKTLDGEQGTKKKISGKKNVHKEEVLFQENKWLMVIFMWIYFVILCPTSVSQNIIVKSIIFLAESLVCSNPVATLFSVN